MTKLDDAAAAVSQSVGAAGSFYNDEIRAALAPFFRDTPNEDTHWRMMICGVVHSGGVWINANEEGEPKFDQPDARSCTAVIWIPKVKPRTPIDCGEAIAEVDE